MINSVAPDEVMTYTNQLKEKLCDFPGQPVLPIVYLYGEKATD
jgi:hypothetical protein